MEWLFTGFALQGALAGLAACALFSLAPRLQKRYGSRWLCRLWLVLAALFLLPMRLALPASWAPVQLPAAPVVLTAPISLPGPGGQAGAGAARDSAEAPLGSRGTNVPAGAFPPAAENAPFPEPPPLTQTQSSCAPAPSPLTWAAWAWLAGAAGLCLWQFLASFFWKRHALRGALPPGAGWQQAFDTAFAASGLARRPALFVHRRGALPSGGGAPSARCVRSPAHPRFRGRRADAHPRADPSQAARSHL